MTDKEKIQRAREETCIMTGFLPEQMGYLYAKARKKDVIFATSESVYREFCYLHKWKKILIGVSVAYFVFLIPVVFSSFGMPYVNLSPLCTIIYIGAGALLLPTDIWFGKYFSLRKKKYEEKIIFFPLV